ncbi:MAG: diadenylate cyclase CdaA [Eubacteriaceae bacterium]|jgi:diadenylate cyclase
MSSIIMYLQSQVTIISLIEIALITGVLYAVLGWIQNTQAEQVVKGLLILLILLPISDWLGLTTINYLVKSMFTWFFLFILVVFQPELRSALESLGSRGFLGPLSKNKKEIKDTQRSIREVITAVRILARDHTGALIVCENQTGLKNIARSGIKLNSRISWELLVNLFTVNRPLHDGAVILSFYNNEVIAAGCLLPLTERRDLISDLGTRHRAGIGISEQSDALVIIVSEETGYISYVINGELMRDVKPEVLEEILTKRYLPQEDDNSENSLTQLWSRKHGKK